MSKCQTLIIVVVSDKEPVKNLTGAEQINTNSAQKDPGQEANQMPVPTTDPPRRPQPL